MTRSACYIAAPYGDPSPTIRAWHTARAALLCRLATLSGYSAVCVHTTIAAGGYGDDSDPAQRAAGMESTLDVCRLVVASGGVAWALKRDDGTVSDGTRAECVAAAGEYVARTWAEWRNDAVAFPALLPEWDRLAARPDAVGEWVPHLAHDCWARFYADGSTAAYVDSDVGWELCDQNSGDVLAEGPETGEAGRAAADAALRAAGVMR